MNQIFSLLKQISAKPVIEVLQLIIAHHAQKSEPPFITLGMARGQFTGWICQANFRDQEIPMTMVTADNHGHPSGDLIFFSGRQIEWLKLHDSKQYFSDLSDGRIDSLEEKDAKGRLVLNRKCGELQTLFRTLTKFDIQIEIDWKLVQENDHRASLIVEQTLDTLDFCIKEITKDSLGLESLVKKVQLVTLCFKESRQMQFNAENKSLMIVLNSKSGRNGYYTSQEILSELNKSL